MTADEKAATLTPEQRAAIEALAEAATPGPWWADSWEIYGGTEDTPRYDEDGDKVWIAESCAGDWGQDTANGKFIAAARTAVPALLAALTEAEADRDRLRAVVERHGPCVCNYGPGTEGPDEFCPRHGRSYGDALEYMQRIIESTRTERDQAAAWDEGKRAGIEQMRPTNPYRTLGGLA